jgi:hypothetical protein
MKRSVRKCREVFLLFAGVTLLLSGCASFDPRDTPPKQPVRAVEFRGVPEIKDLAKRARQVGNESYPKILSLLSENPSEAPQQFSIIFRTHASVKNLMNDDSGGFTWGRKIYLGLDWLTNTPGELDSYLVHEMTHVAQDYSWHRTEPCWTEGIADYVRFKLGYTNGWMCPQCSALYPHYTSGYTCAGAFLLFLDAQYGGGVVGKLNHELRHHSYSDAFFKNTTGKDLKELWSAFQQTPAYTPAAAELWKLEESAGYVNGRPPRKVSAEMIAKIDRARGLAAIKGIPGGALMAEALRFLDNLKDSNQLPGWAKGEKGRAEVQLNTVGIAGETNYPYQHTFTIRKNGDARVFHYTVSRESEQSVWRLKDAWCTDKSGQTVKSYSTTPSEASPKL